MSYSRQSILFISGLDPTVNENMLYSLFNEFPVSYIKIAKDHKTKEPFGYAFVGFKSHSKAEEAISKLNYQKLGKKTIRISWFNREPGNNRTNPQYNVFVKKINKDVGHKEFHDHFSKFGNVVSAKLVEDEEGEVVGVGFVLYDCPEAASKAIKEAHGQEWKGKKLYVGPFIKNKPKVPKKFNNVYVKNIPKTWTKDDIINFFSKYGELGSILVEEPNSKILEKLPESKKDHILSHKYAFVCFKEFDPAMKVVNEVPYYKVNDKNYNAEIDKLIALVKKTNEVDEDKIPQAAVYIIENLEDYKQVHNDSNLLKETIETFKIHFKDNNTYVVKDKDDRIECCQALTKKERAKKLKENYERVKKQIKEKYKFCNLYIKNLPDNFDDDMLRELFGKYGEIKSVKAVRKEMTTSYLGIKRSVKVFGFVCFFDKEAAREAKLALHGAPLGPNESKLFVDYHQTKQERQEYLKLKMINHQGKMGKGMFKGGMHPGMMQMGGMRPMGNMPIGPNMLRKFPPNTGIRQPLMMPQQPQHGELDKNSRRDFYGERLYSKISSNPNFSNLVDHFSKIVGIFLDLKDEVIERLLADDNYFFNQVTNTIELLKQSTNA